MNLEAVKGATVAVAMVAWMKAMWKLAWRQAVVLGDEEMELEGRLDSP